jgi:uncharacterized protein YqeY
MSLVKQISSDMIAAMKAKEAEKLSVIRMLTTAIKNEAINQKVEELDDASVEKVIKSEIKKRKDSIASYEEGGRQEMADAEKAEVTVLEAYLPEQMSEEQIAAKVQEVLAGLSDDMKDNFGAVMGAVMKEVGSGADGNLVREIINKELGK